MKVNSRNQMISVSVYLALPNNFSNIWQILKTFISDVLSLEDVLNY